MTSISAPIYSYTGLGLVASGVRNVTPVPSDLLSLVPLPTNNIVTVKKRNADAVRHTVPLILEKVKSKAWQIKKLAAALKGNSVKETLRNDWNFLFKHIQYKLDDNGKEQVRDPSRLIHEGIGDCDCFSTAIGAMTAVQNIPAVLRIAKYAHSKNPKQFSHVYIVVPKDGNVNSPLTNRNDYYTVDPVVHEFDYEEPYTYKKDFPIGKSMELQSLEGGFSPLYGVNACKPNSQQFQYYERASQFKERGLLLTEEFLTANNIPFKPVEEPAFGYQVSIGNSQLVIKPVITKDQGAGILQAIKNGVSDSSPCACDEAKEKKNLVTWLLWLFGISAAIIVLE